MTKPSWYDSYLWSGTSSATCKHKTYDTTAWRECNKKSYKIYSTPAVWSDSTISATETSYKIYSAPSIWSDSTISATKTSTIYNNKYNKYIYEFIQGATNYYSEHKYDLTANCQAYGSSWTAPVITPSERMRQILASRSAPAFHRGHKRAALALPTDLREIRARATLRRIIGEDKFRRFMRDGFITVVSKTGLTYRVFPGHGITEVYNKGTMVDRLCVVLKGQFPPTDELLMRYLLILNDEGEFSKHARKQGIYTGKVANLKMPEQQSLPELWADMKVA